MFFGFSQIENIGSFGVELFCIRCMILLVKYLTGKWGPYTKVWCVFFSSWPIILAGDFYCLFFWLVKVLWFDVMVWDMSILTKFGHTFFKNVLFTCGYVFSFMYNILPYIYRRRQLNWVLLLIFLFLLFFPHVGWSMLGFSFVRRVLLMVLGPLYVLPQLGVLYGVCNWCIWYVLVSSFYMSEWSVQWNIVWLKLSDRPLVGLGHNILYVTF